MARDRVIYYYVPSPPSPFGAVAEQIFAFYPAPLPRRMIFLLRPPFSRGRGKRRERNGKGNNRLRPPPLRSCDRFLLFKYRDSEFTFFVGPSEGGRERRNLRDFPSYTMLCRSLLLRSAIGALADEDVRHWLSHYKFRGHNTPSGRFGCPFSRPRGGVRSTGMCTANECESTSSLIRAQILSPIIFAR